MTKNDKFAFWLFLVWSFFGNVLCQYCPAASNIGPYCTCNGTTSTTIVMNCSNVETEDQLKTIFTTVYFTYSHMREFIIENNQDLKYLTQNVFGSVTFRIVTFRNSAIQYIDELVFSNSRTYLEEWNMYSCYSVAPGFPFPALTSYSYLTNLHFESSGYFAVMPRIHSSTLTNLDFQDCEIGYVEITSFYDIPRLTSLNLIGNNITSIPPGIFKYNTALQQIHISGNNMEQLAAGTFVNLTALESLYLGMNNISFVEPGALSNLPKLDNVSFTLNNLDYLSSAMLGYLPSVKSIDVEKNNIQLYEIYLFNCCPQLEQFFADENNLTKVTNNDFQGSSVLQELHINMNELSTIAQGSFSNLKNGLLDLDANQLTTLDESWLKLVLENHNNVTIARNPLECGCDIAWLLENPSLLVNVTAECLDGTDIHDLDSSYYVNNCTLKSF